MTGGLGPVGEEDEILPEPRQRSLRPLIAVLIVVGAVIISVRLVDRSGPSTPATPIAQSSVGGPTIRPAPPPLSFTRVPDGDTSIVPEPLPAPAADGLVPLTGNRVAALGSAAPGRLVLGYTMINSSPRPLAIRYPLQVSNRAGWTTEFAGLVGAGAFTWTFRPNAPPKRVVQIAPHASVLLLVALGARCTHPGLGVRPLRSPGTRVSIQVRGRPGRVQVAFESAAVLPDLSGFVGAVCPA